MTEIRVPVALSFDPTLTPGQRLEAAFRRRYGHEPLVIGQRRDGSDILGIRGGAEKLFLTQNSTVQTTAALVKQPTGTAIRTMLQLASGTANKLTIVEWGISYDGIIATSVPIATELFATSVAATMTTALAATDVTLLNGPGDEASNIQYGAALSAFATAAVTEGTVANARNFDIQLIAPTTGYVKQWPLGREPVVPVSRFLRVRVTAGVTVNAYIYVIWSE